MGLTIRRALTPDAEAICALNQFVQALHAEAEPDRFKPPGPDVHPASLIAGWIVAPDAVFLVAEEEREIAGYLYAQILRVAGTTYAFAREEILIHHLCVRPESRRKGVASSLLDAARADGQALGITTFTLEVWSFNEAARAFYRRRGFEPYAERLRLR